MTKYPDDLVLFVKDDGTPAFYTHTHELHPHQERVGPYKFSIDTATWKDWPWSKITLKRGDVLVGRLRQRDVDGNLLMVCGTEFYQFDPGDVILMEHGPDADLSLAGEIEGCENLPQVDVQK
jgi:hypothetical protein